MKQSVIFLVILFVIISTAVIEVKAQNNPDGNSASIHFTPYTIDAPGKFCYNVMLKIPLTDAFTVSPFYEEFTLQFASTNGFSYSNNSVKTTYSKWGATFSFYFE